LNTQFRMLDKDGNGRLSYDEIMQGKKEIKLLQGVPAEKLLQVCVIMLCV
jgi:hypothetical protein